MSKIVRVWGYADEISIELSQQGERWVCSLPPDFVDGQYAVRLYALKESGTVGIYTGILNTCMGISCLHLEKAPITCFLAPNKVEFSVISNRVSITLIKECPIDDQ